MRKIGKLLIFALGLSLSTLYLWTYLAQSQTTLRTVVFGLFLLLTMLAMIDWRRGVLTFVFCFPLFNTISALLGTGDVWPPFNFNLLFISALSTAALTYWYSGRPLDYRRRGAGLPSTPLDLWWVAFLVVIWSTALLGMVRYNNIFCPGFFQELPSHISNLPFDPQTGTFLCFTRALQLSCMVLAFYFVSSVLHDRADVYRMLKLLLIAALPVVVYSLWQFQTKEHMVGIQQFFGRVNATFNGPDSAASYFVAISVLAFTYFWHVRKAAGYLFAAFLTVAALVGLALTGSRTPTFALGIALGVALLLALVRAGRIFRAAPFFLGLLAVWFFFAPGNELKLPGSYLVTSIRSSRLFQGVENLNTDRRKVDEWLSFRSYHWYAARNAIKDSPVFGQGLGTLDKLYSKFKYPRDTYNSAFAHNLYMDYYSEAGSPGLVISIAIYLLAIMLAWRLWAGAFGGKKLRSLALALVIILMAVSFGNLFSSSFFYVVELMMMQAVLLAMLCALFNDTYPREQRSLPARLGTAWAALWRTPARRLGTALALLVLAAIFVWRFNINTRKGEAQYYSCEPYNSLGRILEYGFDHYETDNSGNKFARTGRCAYRPLALKSRYLKIYLRASHPDADLRPVPATFTINGRLAGSIVLSNRNWTAYTLDVSRALPQFTNDNVLAKGETLPISLGMTSGRLWNPMRWNPAERNIDYGADLGTILQGLY